MRERYCTKWLLVKRCTKPLRRPMLALWAAYVLFFTICSLVRHTAPYTILMVNGFWTLFVLLLFLVLSLVGAIPGFLLLRRQERCLGFRFADEKIPLDRPDARWFISCDFYLTAFRRGFLRKTGKIHRIGNRGLCKMAVLDFQGKRYVIRDDRETLSNRKRWHADIMEGRL